jgi:hypothetical protein
MLILLTFMYCMAFVQTLRDSIDSGRSRLSSRQCAHVNFLKLVQQALSARLRQCSQTRKHSMLTADVVTAITQCHEAAVRLSVASTMLSEQKNPGGAAANKSDKKPAAKRGKKVPNMEGTAAPTGSSSSTIEAPCYSCQAVSLSIRDRSTTDSEPIHINIAAGERVHTCFGLGVVDGFDCKAKVVKIQLSFGFLYAAFETAIEWKVKSVTALQSVIVHNALVGKDAKDEDSTTPEDGDDSPDSEAPCNPALNDLSLDESHPNNMLQHWKSLRHFILNNQLDHDVRTQAILKKPTSNDSVAGESGSDGGESTMVEDAGSTAVTDDDDIPSFG